MAVFWPQQDSLKLLLQYGADTELVDVDGDTALTNAVIYQQSSTAAYLLKHGADPTITNNKGKSALQLMEENPAFADIIYLPTSDVNTYIEAIQASWEKVDIPSVIFPFESNKNLTSAYYKLVFGCEKIGWKCIEKSMNFAAFIVSRENDTKLIVHHNKCGENCPYASLHMELYCAKTGDNNQSQKIPAIYYMLENAKLLQVNRVSVTAPHVCPCAPSGAGDYTIKPGCLVKCSELELEDGRFANALCHKHHKMKAGEKIAVWFIPKDHAADDR